MSSRCLVTIISFLLGFFATLSSNGQGRITHYAGNFTIGYGGDGGPATSATLQSPYCLVTDTSGNLFISDCVNQIIRKIDVSTGIITCVAGRPGLSGSSGDGGMATNAFLDQPHGIFVDKSGNLYICTSNRVRRVDAVTGIITRVAGNVLTGGYSGDGGAATSANLLYPESVWLDDNDNMFIADEGNDVIRKVNSSGIISTYAGTGTGGFAGDGGPATLAKLDGPGGMTGDQYGNLYFADALNDRIRKIDAVSGTISSLSGNGVSFCAGIGGPASAAQLSDPGQVSVDAAGNVYFINELRTVNKIDHSTGVVSYYVAACFTGGYSGDGGPATAATCNDIFGMCRDKWGNMYITDYALNIIRKIGTEITVFTGGATQSLTLCTGSAATSIDALMTISDPHPGLTETWTVVSGPTHGTLAGFSASALSTGSNITPSGMSYTPGTGYAGSDVFTVQISNGLDSMTTTINVMVDPVPNAGTITGSSVVCLGTPLSLSNPTGTAGGVWSSSNTSVATVVAASGLVTGVSGGSTTVSYTFTNSCGTVFTTAVLTASITPGVIAGFGNVCTGALLSLSNSSAGGVWSSSMTGTATIDAATGVVSGITAGSTLISYTAPWGCLRTRLINVQQSPDVIGGTLSVCTGATTQLTNGTTGGTWSSSSAATATIDALLGSVTGSAAGSVTITYSVSNGCYSLATLAVNTSPAMITGPVAVCTGNTISLNNIVPGGNWTSDAPSLATVNGTSGVVTGVAAGTATITYTNAGCYTVHALTVAVSPDAIQGASSLCVADVIYLSDASAGGTWSSSVATVASINTSSGMITGIAAGNTIISYTLPSGCAATKPIIVNTCTTGVQAVDGGRHIEVFPNPADDELIITSSDRIANVAVINSLGQVVLETGDNSSEIHIGVRTLAAGVYVLKIDGRYCRQFVKR